MLYAHTSDTNKEPLVDHLIAVANHCKSLASKFGAGDYGWIAGAFHDLGKSKPKFQAKLNGEKNNESHSAEGAASVLTAYPNFGKLIAPTIMGHHTGLANGFERSTGRPRIPFIERLKEVQKANPISPMLTLQRDVQPPINIPCNKFEIQFFMRMLFSCLVDADFLETEKFINTHSVNSKVLERGWNGKIIDLRVQLDKFLLKFENPDSEIKKLRNEILQSAKCNAKLDPGLFTFTVPTGGGKTLSSLAFAIEHAIKFDMDRIIYVIPFTSIIEQTADVFRSVFSSIPDPVLEHHSDFDWEMYTPDDQESTNDSEKIRLATENWDRPIIITTAVQFFESFYSNRTSKCRKLHNICRSVVVLDEAQTLPMKVLRPCLAVLLTLAKTYSSSIVLCTATQPAILSKFNSNASELLPEAFPDEKTREIAPNPESLYCKLRRSKVTNCGKIDDEHLAEKLLAEKQVLCIVNNKRHARILFNKLSLEGNCWHLSTNMCANHRRHKLSELKTQLNSNQIVRVVSTSLVEAGVDIDFPCVWRAIAGIDSIAQAAGRCNREGKLGIEGGHVYVFKPLLESEFLPPPEIQRFANLADNILKNHSDPLTLDAVYDYYNELIWQCGTESLDSLKVGKHKLAGIISTIKSTGAIDGTSYAFADIAHAFKMIEENTIPIIIPGGNSGSNFGLPVNRLDDLYDSNNPEYLARVAQPYVVQISTKIRQNLIESKNAKVINQEVYGDQFVVLDNPEFYNDDTGFDSDEIKQFENGRKK